ncbi:hypothetical protein HZS_6009 [Henneguya salminicola]|nr:hypothetical protein HZS_6009 [Henneguya salminicola]
MFCNPSTLFTGFFSLQLMYMAPHSTIYRDKETVRSIFKMFAAFAFIQAYEALHDRKVALSHYFPFDYGINPKELKSESVGPIINSKVGIMPSHVSLGEII